MKKRKVSVEPFSQMGKICLFCLFLLVAFYKLSISALYPIHPFSLHLPSDQTIRG
jgi:hypothetical protein